MKKNKKYTINDYSPEEQEMLSSLYQNHFDKTFEQTGVPFSSKELHENQILRVRITGMQGNVAIAETPVGQTILIDVKKEEKSVLRLGFPPITIDLDEVLDVVVFKDKIGNYKGSVAAGYEKSLKSELTKSINDENTAYSVTIESLCPGGFMVNLSGIKCFLPGSLAAANRITDFSSYLGKTMYVMVEIYDDRRNIFVVSFKKYLRRVINSKVQELSLAKKYTGSITGASSAGIFVEWDEYYTGLIPAEEFDTFDSSKYQNGGEDISFYVIDLKNPQRIVLSIKEPDNKSKDLQELKDVSLMKDKENKIYTGIISKVKGFGIFVKLSNGLVGLIEKEKLVYPPKEYNVGDSISCTVLGVEIQTSKLHLKQTIEGT